MTLSNFPEQRSAEDVYADFLALDAQDDQIVKHDWWFDRFAIPTPDSFASREEGNLAQLTCGLEVGRVAKLLLERDNKWLEVVSGVGYRIVPPAEQAERAAPEALRQARRALAFGADLLTHLRPMDDSVRKEAIDAGITLSRVAQVVNAVGHPRKWAKIIKD